MPEAKKARYDAQCLSKEEAVRRVMTDFAEVQEKLERLTTQMSEEGLQVVRRVCQQYTALKAPHFASRAALLNKLPRFWPTVCTRHPQLSPHLTADDAELLQYLRDVTVKEYEDVQCGFRVEFLFGENPQFAEELLVKTVSFTNEGDMIVDGTSPTWKEPETVLGKGQEQQKRKCEKSYSFFLWFGERGTMENGQIDELSFLFKNDIWPNPMRFYSQPEGELDPEQDVGAMEEDPPVSVCQAGVMVDAVLPGEPLSETMPELREKKGEEFARDG